MDLPFNLVCCPVLAVAVATSLLSTCLAQEVASVDLTGTTAGTELRHPKATSTTPPKYGGISESHHCGDSEHRVGSLRTSVVSLDRTHYQDGDEFTFEVTVENAGSTPIAIPFSPHLADLQPKDAGQKFGYSALQIIMWIAAGEQWSATTGGDTTLYGDDHHDGTMLSLSPGEWVRIIGKGQFGIPRGNLSDEMIHSHEIDRVYGKAELSREETLMTPTQSATVKHEICVANLQGRKAPIQLVIP